MTCDDESNVGYTPHGAAAAFWKCKATEVLIEGPAGTGKTRAVWEKILRLAQKYPGSRHLVCRKTRESMTDSVLVTFEEKVIDAPWQSVLGVGRLQRKNRHSYTLPNGSEIVVGGLDMPSRTFSAEYDTVTIFEAIEVTEDDWELLHRSLRNGKMGYHQAIADTNPGPPSHWLNQRANAGRMVRLLSRHEDNPLLFDHKAGKWTDKGIQYIAILDALTGHRKLRLRFGKWVAAEGVVYGDFDSAVHVIDKMPAGWREWRKIRSIDFGYTNPFVCQWWAIDGDGRMYLYREIYRTRRIINDHAPKIAAASRYDQYEATVADHDAEDRATLAAFGIETRPAFKAIKPGLDAVMARLRKAGDGKPRLFLLRSALMDQDEELAARKLPFSTEQEFGEYIWPKGVGGKAEKEKPEDMNNHGMDAMRYAVAFVDDLGAGVPWDSEDFQVVFGKPDPMKKTPYELLRDKLLSGPR